MAAAVAEGGTSINLGSQLSALSLSPDKTRAFVVGRDVLKIVSLQNGLRTTHNMRPGKTHMNYTGNDCAWNPLEQAKHLLATAATNGAVVIWNIVRDGQTRQEQILTEHTRAVNRVTWHPENWYMILTGSQDGSMKLWDIREKAVSSRTFQGHSESVRDVQFSPFYPNYFAAGFDNGNVQIWDIRNATTWKDTITAHQGLVLTVDWHPEEKNWIATGGRDRLVKVWDLRKNQFIHTIQTISSVARVKWRPNHKHHIATCASLLDFRIHIWDVQKPYIPIGGLVGHRDVATGLVWQNGYSLLSCSKDSTVIMHNTSNAERPATTIRTAALSWSVKHELASANDPIIRADIHDLRPSDIPAPPPLFSNKSAGVVRILSSLGSFKEFGPSFDTPLFIYFAENYKLTGAPLMELCEHNSDVAAQAQQHQIAQVWQLIKIFYDPEFDPIADMDTEPIESESIFSPPLHHPHSHSSEDDEDNALNIVQDSLFEPVLMDDSKSNGMGFDLPADFLLNEAVSPLSPLPLRSTNMFSNKPTKAKRLSSIPTSANNSPPSRPHTPPHTPPLQHSSSTESPLLSRSLNPPAHTLPPPVGLWEHGDVVLQLLQHFAERGDVQNCVAICTVLRGKLEVPKDMFLRWTSSYIELLQRHCLWTTANTHVKLCAEPQISHINQQSTTIHTGCAHCGKPLFSKGWACEKCKKLIAICSICQQPVKGMYVWCQGCGHGGHLTHLREWFIVQGQKLCPGGCSHYCTFKPNVLR